MKPGFLIELALEIGGMEEDPETVPDRMEPGHERQARRRITPLMPRSTRWKLEISSPSLRRPEAVMV